jgi:hypothetical protein
MGEGYPRLEAAERRLEDALARLETALVGDRSSAAAQPSVAGAELGDALAEARRQNDALKQLSRDAASRLDNAIAQIDLLLED